MPSGTSQLVIGSSWDGVPIDPAEEVTLELRWDEGALHIHVDAPFWGDPRPDGAASSTEGLWEFEVVELFVADAESPSMYTEIELGPHGHFLVLLFSGVRQRVAEGIPIDFSPTIEGRRWSGVATLDADHLPAQPWRANAYAIHGVGSGRRYLAAHPLPGPRADFHQPERFPRLS